MTIKLPKTGTVSEVRVLVSIIVVGQQEVVDAVYESVVGHKVRHGDCGPQGFAVPAQLYPVVFRARDHPAAVEGAEHAGALRELVVACEPCGGKGRVRK